MKPASIRNRVLLSMSKNTRDEVVAACDRLDVATGTVLARTGESTPAIWFPETAVISTLATYRDGSVIEMANVGSEACTGTNLLLGNPRQLNTDEVQVRGLVLALPTASFQGLVGRLPEFEKALHAAVQGIFYQVMVSGACNGIHTTRQRLARWLLTMDDRSNGNELRLTQEFLAEILGVRRATITDAASQLQSAGHIDYARGRIRISDRAGLEAASCECYVRVKAAYADLMPEIPNGK